MSKNNSENVLKDISEWLQGDQSDIETGAMLMLRCNRNRILYANICARPLKMKAKLVYELTKQHDLIQRKKELNIVSKLTETQTKELRSMELQIKKTPTSIGKREDHDALPTQIQQLYEDNLQRYPRMTQIHERLKSFTLDCDRYPFVKELVELQQALIRDWDIYDKATTSDVKNEVKSIPDEKTETKTTTMTPKEVIAARKYISDNKAKLKGEKASNWLPRVQQRVDALLSAGENISEAQLNELKENGIVTP